MEQIEQTVKTADYYFVTGFCGRLIICYTFYDQFMFFLLPEVLYSKTFLMVLHFLVGECREGSAPLASDLFVAYEAHQELISSWSFYTE